MATTATQSKYRRASEFIQGIGANLDTIAGKDVLLWEFTVEPERKFGNGTNTFVSMKISTMDDEENIQLFHAWSESLATRLEELNGADGVAYPLIVKFEKANTSSGQKVWTVS